MRLGKIVLKLRLANTRFADRIGGVVDLQHALKNVLEEEYAFVVPDREVAADNKNEGGVDQLITESFSVVVAIKADVTQKDKNAFKAYEALHSVRSEIFAAIAGNVLTESASTIYYKGANLLGVDDAYLWYQYNFAYESRLGADGIETYEWDDTETPANFERIYADYIMSDDTRLPHTTGLPLADGYPDVTINSTDTTAQMINE